MSTLKCLITGGAGCIGSDLAEALLARGHEVVAADNLSSGKIEHIQPLQENPRFSFFEGDLLDPGFTRTAVAGCDIVFHLAANPDVKFTEGDATNKDLEQNILVTYNVLDAMRIHGVRKLGFASTSAIYGVSPVQPIPESLAPQPISLYGATKLGCEGLISAFGNLFGMQCWVFRFANIVGAKVRKRGRTVISDFVHRLNEDPSRLTILGNGKQAKSYLLSSECVDAMLFIVDNEHAPYSVYNLGCEGWLEVDQIAKMVVDAMGLEDVLFEYTGGEGGWPGDVPRFRLDVSALNRLGWRARLDSGQAVAHAIREIVAQSPAPRAACKP